MLPEPHLRPPRVTADGTSPCRRLPATFTSPSRHVPAAGPPRGHTRRRSDVGCDGRRCHDRPMPTSSAELSSLATALDELTRRVTGHAEAADAAKDEETARELFAIERSLSTANRRLTRLALALARR